MFRYAMINNSTNVVDNVCNWNGELTTWTPPEGYIMVKLTDEQAPVGIWWTYVNGVFTEPVYEEPVVETTPTVQGAEML